MKFMDKSTGRTVNDIGTAKLFFCAGRTCDECPLGKYNMGDKRDFHGCTGWVRSNVEEAADLMMYEIVQEGM